MKKLSKKEIVISALIVIFLIAVFFPEKPRISDFGVTYIGYQNLTAFEERYLLELFTEKLHDIEGYENAEIEFNAIAVTDKNNTAKDAALAQLLYGNGNIYVASYELIMKLIDDEDVFAELPEDIEADIFTESGKKVAISVNNMDMPGLARMGEELCVFVRSDIVEDRGLSEYMSKNRNAAFRIMKSAKNT